MKKVLTKSLSLLTVAALMFSYNISSAVSETVVVQDEVCNQSVHYSYEEDESLTSEGNPVVTVDPIHEAWTASIPGAEWIWSENPIADPVGETIQTFEKTFNIGGLPAESELIIAADNSYSVSVNGNPIASDAGENNHASADTHVILAGDLVSGENTLEFVVTNWPQEGGTMASNPAGLMYKLTVNCTPDEEGEEPVCPPENDNNCEEPDDTDESCPVVYARVNFSEVDDGAEADGWKNWEPGGDVAPQAFVGATDSVFADEEWFPLTNPDGSPIDDDDVSGYRDVLGVAIERLDGKVRLVLYGYHDQENGELGGKEYASGVIELDGATWDTMQSPLDWSNDDSNPRTHDPLINDSVNPMESRGDFTGAIDQHDYRFDRMKTLTPTKVAFTLVVTAGADGFYATYDIDEDCDDGEDPDPCTEDCPPPCEVDCPPPPCEVDCDPPIVIPGCMDEEASNYNSDATEDNGSCEYPETNDLGDDDDNGGGGSSSGSRQSSGGGNGGGEVLGAETSICSWDVNTYMRRGYKNDPAQVMILQRDLLNGYMNAGVAVDGIYGPSTEKAVKAFQKAKGDKIIKPWYNLFQPTGIFFRTTLVEAKNTICPDEILPIPTNLIDWSQSSGEVPSKI